MNSFPKRGVLLLVAFVLSVAGWMPATAGVPKKQPLGRYTDLWGKSPFTVPPVEVIEEKVVVNPLEDYTLAGVCELKEGWFVVLINKKKRDDRIRLRPNVKNEQGFEVVKVSHGTRLKETKVEISHGGKSGWVEYDEKFLVVKKAVATAPRGQTNARPGTSSRPADPRRPGGPSNMRGGPPIPSRGSNPTTSGRGRVPSPPSTAGSNRPPVPTPSGGQSSSRGRPSGDRSSGGRPSRGRGR